jgi:hypothetical protein
MTSDPHGHERILSGGAPLSRARLAMIMLHGRVGAPKDMLGLAEHLGLPDIAVRAPEAAGHSWWPDSFLAPLTRNEPRQSELMAQMWSGLDTQATCLVRGSTTTLLC